MTDYEQVETRLREASVVVAHLRVELFKAEAELRKALPALPESEEWTLCGDDARIEMRLFYARRVRSAFPAIYLSVHSRAPSTWCNSVPPETATYESAAAAMKAADEWWASEGAAKHGSDA